MPFGDRPEVPEPSPEIYAFFGEQGVRQLIDRHYELLSTSAIAPLFPPKGKALDLAKTNSADFFIQRLGGPSYYQHHRGRPMLVQRHSPFRITPQAREIWLDCFRTALQETQLPEQPLLNFWAFLHQFSNWMVNRPQE